MRASRDMRSGNVHFFTDIDSLSRQVIACVLALLTTAAAAPVYGQAPEASNDGERLLSGSALVQSRPGRSVRADAHAAALNPALLGLVEIPELSYELVVSDSAGSGHGIYLSVPFLGVLGVGAAIELVGDDLESNPMRRYRVGLGLRLGKIGGIGFTYSAYGSDHDAAVDAHDSVELGLTTRIIPGLVLGAVVERLDTPRFRGTALEPFVHLTAGTALLDGRLKLDATATLGDELDNGNDLVRIAATAQGTPIAGLTLFGDLHHDRPSGGAETRWGGGLSLDFGHIGIRGGAYAATTSADTRFDGVNIGASFRAESVESLSEPMSSRWIRLRLPGAAPERSAQTPFGPAGPSFADILITLDHIADDPSVDGVVLEIAGTGYGFGQLYELREAVDRIRSVGTRVVAHLDDTSTRSLYLASAADKILISPGQVVRAAGIATTSTFYRGVFRLFGIQPHFAKIDEYKTAPDSYLRSEPSEYHEEQLDEYLDTIFDMVVGGIADGRGLSVGLVRSIFDEAPLRPKEAVAAGLIDGLAYSSDLASALETHLDLAHPPALELGYHQPRPIERAWTERKRVVVVYIDGTITKGPSIDVPLLGSVTTGSATIEAVLDWAASAPNVAGVVLRIDSPGGSAHASELIHHRLEKLAESRPLVVSMGDVAASGGYYVAAPAHKIFATPSTLTGSIGIFAGKFDFSQGLARLGINEVLFKRGEFSDLFGPYSSWDDEAKLQVQNQIEHLYDEFTDRVARGRNMDRSHVRAVAEGRVWTGERAVQNGLVDEVGGLLRAIDEVKVMAGLDIDETIEVLHVPRRGPLSFLDLGIPIGILSAEDHPPSTEPSTLELDDAAAILIRNLIGVGPVAAAALLAPGEPLAILPYDWKIVD